MRPSLDVPAIAEQLGTSRDHVRRMARSGRIPHFRIGGFIRFDPDEITEWLESRHVSTRESQGLPPKIEDPAAIARVAELVSTGDAGGDGT
jgi:excisionase family DNA binding protein